MFEAVEPRESSDGVLVVRVEVVRDGVIAVRDAELVATRDELPLALEIVGTPLEVVRLGDGR